MAYLLTGRRRSEALNLRWRDLDLEGGFYRYTGNGGTERQRALPPLVRQAIALRCIRARVVPLDADSDTAVAHAAAIEQTLADAGVSLEQVHHGDGIASWAVNLRAIPRGHGIRTGLEDTPVLPDRRPAKGNGDLVAASTLGRHEGSERSRSSQ